MRAFAPRHWCALLIHFFEKYKKKKFWIEESNQCWAAISPVYYSLFNSNHFILFVIAVIQLLPLIHRTPHQNHDALTHAKNFRKFAYQIETMKITIIHHIIFAYKHWHLHTFRLLKLRLFCFRRKSKQDTKQITPKTIYTSQWNCNFSDEIDQ